MGTVVVSIVTLGNWGRTGGSGGDFEIPDSSVTGVTESLTSTTSAATATLAGTGIQGEFWSITPKDTQVWIKFGASPTATANGDIFLGEIGRTYYFKTVNGDKVAALDNV